MTYKWVIASDHAGTDLKAEIISSLSAAGDIIEDCGVTPDSGSVDYPDQAHLVTNKIQKNPDLRGILVCGSGIGISIAANRFPHIRAALCYSEETAALSRQHNDANIIVLGARTMPHENALKYLNIFRDTDFEGGRHEKRVEKLGEL